MSDKLEEPDASNGPIRISMGARLRGYFFAGVLVTAPLAITVYIAWLLISFVDERVFSVIPPVYNPETYLPFSVPGIGLILMVLVLTLVGALTAGYLGKLVLRLSERLLNRMPVVRNIYGTAKQIVETVVNNKTSAFREVVLVEYPRAGMWTIGVHHRAQHGRNRRDRRRAAGRMFIVPTTPNPTSGFLLFLPDQDVHRLPMTVEEAVKLVISGGHRHAAGAPAGRGPTQESCRGPDNPQAARRVFTAASRSNKIEQHAQRLAARRVEVGIARQDEPRVVARKRRAGRHARRDRRGESRAGRSAACPALRRRRAGADPPRRCGIRRRSRAGC